MRGGRGGDKGDGLAYPVVAVALAQERSMRASTSRPGVARTSNSARRRASPRRRIHRDPSFNRFRSRPARTELAGRSTSRSSRASAPSRSTKPSKSNVAGPSPSSRPPTVDGRVNRMRRVSSGKSNDLTRLCLRRVVGDGGDAADLPPASLSTRSARLRLPQRGPPAGIGRGIRHMGAVAAKQDVSLARSLFRACARGCGPRVARRARVRPGR